MADNFVNGFHGMREFHGTFGDLMDTANRTGDSGRWNGAPFRSRPICRNERRKP